MRKIVGAPLTSLGGAAEPPDGVGAGMRAPARGWRAAAT